MGGQRTALSFARNACAGGRGLTYDLESGPSKADPAAVAVQQVVN